MTSLFYFPCLLAKIFKRCMCVYLLQIYMWYILYDHLIKNDWASRATKSTSDFVLSLNIPPRKLFRWLTRSQLWETGEWQLHHDNVPTHASRLMQRFLAKHQITQVTKPPYSSDLAPCNFWLFPKLKSYLKGKRFHTVDEIQENTMGQMMAIWRTVWGSKVPTLKGAEASFSYA